MKSHTPNSYSSENMFVCRSAVAVATLLLSCFSAIAATSGTGFFISSDGLLVTNFHVVDRSTDIKVKTSNGSIRKARLVVADRSNDIAILEVEEIFGQNFLSVRSTATVNRGARIFTIGFPLLSIQGVESKITDGIVSSLTGLEDDPTMMQISVPIQPGNSGGPLIAMDGAVIGVVTSKLNAAKVQNMIGDIPQNVNFAIKSAYLLELYSHRAITGRAKPVARIGPSSTIEELVRKSEQAVAIVISSTPPLPDQAVAAKPRPPETASPSIPIDDKTVQALAFGNVKFSKINSYLVVEDIDYKNGAAKTTLRIGDRVEKCVNYPGDRIYVVEDINKCSIKYEVDKAVVGKQYLLRVARLGQSSIASIVIRDAN